MARMQLVKLNKTTQHVSKRISRFPHILDLLWFQSLYTLLTLDGAIELSLTHRRSLPAAWTWLLCWLTVQTECNASIIYHVTSISAAHHSSVDRSPETDQLTLDESVTGLSMGVRVLNCLIMNALPALLDLICHRRYKIMFNVRWKINTTRQFF